MTIIEIRTPTPAIPTNPIDESRTVVIISRVPRSRGEGINTRASVRGGITR